MKRSTRGITLAVAAAAALIVGQSQAQAVNTFTVQANSPKPAVCDNSGTIPAGTWIQNTPCGYFVGEAMANSPFDDQETSGADFHYGRDHGDANLCGWIPPGALSASPIGTADPSCSSTTESAEAHRLTFGHNFNAPKHAATDGSAITVSAGCQEDYNYFTTSDFTAGSLRDPAGTSGTTVMYRYTANGDGSVMEVRDPSIGWVFMPISCVTNWDGVSFYNDND